MPNWPDNTAVITLATPLIRQFEGFRGSPYLDSAGVPTIGYGTILYPNGISVTMSDSAISEFLAETYLMHQAEMKGRQLAQLLQRMPTVPQAAAMLSLVYKSGSGPSGLRPYCADSTRVIPRARRTPSSCGTAHLSMGSRP